MGGRWVRGFDFRNATRTENMYIDCKGVLTLQTCVDSWNLIEILTRLHPNSFVYLLFRPFVKKKRVLISGTPEKTTDSGIIDKRGLLDYKNYLKMITENESNQIKNELEKKPDLPKKPSVLTLLAMARIYKRKEQERDQAFAKQQEAQIANKGEEVESPKVETEQKSILYQVTDLKVNKKQVN